MRTPLSLSLSLSLNTETERLGTKLGETLKARRDPILERFLSDDVSFVDGSLGAARGS